MHSNSFILSFILLTVAESETFSEGGVVVGGLNAPNLLKQLELLAVALVCNGRSGSSGGTRSRGSTGGASGTTRGSWSCAGNRSTQRFREHVVETHSKSKENHEKCDNVAPKQWLVQIKVVDNENGSELQRDEREGVLRWRDELVLVANVDSHRHKQPIKPCKRDGHFVSGKHAHVWKLQSDELTPHGRSLCTHECNEPKKVIQRSFAA